MKVVTWNVNGIRARKDDVAAFVAGEKPDILCLQEIKALPGQVPESLGGLVDYWCYWHGMKGYSGVALLVSKRLSFGEPRFMHPDFDQEARVVVGELTTAFGEVTVASVYVTNGGKDFEGKMAFLRAMANYVASARAVGRSLIVCGDLNIARAEIDVHPSERDARAVGQRPEERAMFEEILAGGELRDLGRDLDPTNERLYTWWAPWRNLRQRNIGWRIDYVLASSVMAGRAQAAVSMREVGTSDHAPLVVTFDDGAVASPLREVSE